MLPHTWAASIIGITRQVQHSTLRKAQEKKRKTWLRRDQAKDRKPNKKEVNCLWCCVHDVCWVVWVVGCMRVDRLVGVEYGWVVER